MHLSRFRLNLASKSLPAFEKKNLKNRADFIFCRANSSARGVGTVPPIPSGAIIGVAIPQRIKNGGHRTRSPPSSDRAGKQRPAEQPPRNREVWELERASDRRGDHAKNQDKTDDRPPRTPRSPRDSRRGDARN